MLELTGGIFHGSLAVFQQSLDEGYRIFRWIKDDKGMDPKDLKPPVGKNFQPKLVGFTL